MPVLEVSSYTNIDNALSELMKVGRMQSKKRAACSRLRSKPSSNDQMENLYELVWRLVMVITWSVVKVVSDQRQMVSRIVNWV